MFSDLATPQTYETKGPFKCTWIDAVSGRANSQVQNLQVVGKLHKVETVAKFWLEDVLEDKSQPYGATYFDQADHLLVGTKRYEIQGYDRYGMGLTAPYMIEVALVGSYTSDG